MPWMQGDGAEVRHLEPGIIRDNTAYGICSLNVQGIHKKMVWFQKLTRNLFLTLHWHNIHRQQQQQQLSKFLMR